MELFRILETKESTSNSGCQQGVILPLHTPVAIWQCLETFLTVRIGGGGLLCAGATSIQQCCSTPLGQRTPPARWETNCHFSWMSVVPRFICPAVCIARNGITRSPLSQNRFGPERGWECGQGGRVGDYRCGCWSFDVFIWFPFSWPFFVLTLGIAIVEKTVKKTSFCKQLRRVVPYPELMMSVHFLFHLQLHCKPASHAFGLPWCLGTYMTLGLGKIVRIIN